MNKVTLFSLVLCVYCMAEFIKNPDSNTLWLENGVNIETDPGRGYKGWVNTTMDISYTPATEESEGYFTFKSPESKKHSTRRYVPISKDYPWLEFEILSYIPDAVAYKNFWLGIYKGKNMFTNIPKPGIYLQNLWFATPFEKAVGLIDFTIYGYEVNFKYIKIVKEPENSFFIDSPAYKEKECCEIGDKLIFTAKLAAPAEDVTITFWDTRAQNPVRINGNDSITLKPTNEETTEWRAECDLKSMSGKWSTIVFKCTVLGGKLKKPMYTNNPYPFKHNNQ